MKTKVTTPKDIEKKWYVIDAAGKPLGRVASKIAIILQGKHKPYYTPNLDTGDYVIVVNADKVVLTGNKYETKEYTRHSGYKGGRKVVVYKDLIKKKPEMPLEEAVRGMLPKTKLGRQMFKKLFVYAGDNHPHQAQKPELLNI